MGEGLNKSENEKKKGLREKTSLDLVVTIDGETRVVGNIVNGGPENPPVLGARCSGCGGDPGNGSGGYSSCCGKEIEEIPESELELIKRKAWEASEQTVI